MFDRRMQQQGRCLIYIQSTISVRRLSRAGVREPAQKVCRLENERTFRRSAQSLGTLYVDPKSNRYIPKNLLAPVNHVSWSVEEVTHPPTIHHCSLLTLYISFISRTKMPTRFTACKATTQTAIHSYGTLERPPRPDRNAVRTRILTYAIGHVLRLIP